MSDLPKLPLQKLLAVLLSPVAVVVVLAVAIVAALLYFGVSGPAIAAGALVLLLAVVRLELEAAAIEQHALA